MMRKAKNHQSKEPDEVSNKYIVFLELLTEVIAWFAIVVSLSFFAGIISFIILLLISGQSGFIIAMIILGLGVVTSIIYASYIWKTTGTVNFISNSSWKYNNVDKG